MLPQKVRARPRSAGVSARTRHSQFICLCVQPHRERAQSCVSPLISQGGVTRALCSLHKRAAMEFSRIVSANQGVRNRAKLRRRQVTKTKFIKKSRRWERRGRVARFLSNYDHYASRRSSKEIHARISLHARAPDWRVCVCVASSSECMCVGIISLWHNICQQVAFNLPSVRWTWQLQTQMQKCEGKITRLEVGQRTSCFVHT
jgi:hypothetical protein